MEQLLHLKAIWEKAQVRAEWTASEADIFKFEISNGVRFPESFRSYLMLVNGMGGETDGNLYKFYSINAIENIVTHFGDWHGIPKYSNLPQTLEHPEEYYVFADYFINLFAYAIRLNNAVDTVGSIHALCGGEHRLIANSFSEFVTLYLEDDDALAF